MLSISEFESGICWPHVAKGPVTGKGLVFEGLSLGSPRIPCTSGPSLLTRAGPIPFLVGGLPDVG